MSEKRSENESTAAPLQDDPLGDSQSPGPLRRWLKRRRQVKAEDEKPIIDPLDNAGDRQAQPLVRSEASAQGCENASPQMQAPLAEGIDGPSDGEIEGGRVSEGEADKKILTDADMPPIESLNEHSDYSGFLSPGVSEELRRRALRKLFLSAAFNVRDGLDDYDDDFTSFEALGDMVTADMKHQMEAEAERAQAAQAHTESETETESEIARAAEHTAETAPDENQDQRQDKRKATQDRLAARREEPNLSEDESAEAPDTATLAAKSHTAEAGDPKSAFHRQTPIDTNRRSSDSYDPPSDSASMTAKTTDATLEKERDKNDPAQSRPTTEKPAQKPFENDSTEAPDTATTDPAAETSQAPSSPTPPSPTPRAK
ncbi:MAG: DUF3306 domain-containing protein [Ectothiorhodospiraceae bacterium AqS1]|nr:DUF3306 domain-containing protein [Ectothiorhodospiraceae bacterium AqS1]